MKIIVVGFPHCGTSILKCKLGDARDCFDIHREMSKISAADLVAAKKRNISHVVTKFPSIPPELETCGFDLSKSKTYSDYKVVFIIRDPRYCFTSIKQRGLNVHTVHRTNIATYHKTIAMFDRLRTSPMPNVFTITYEELFTPALEDLMHGLGLQPPESLESREESKGQHYSLGYALPSVEPPRKTHDAFRTWQINQPFRNMNTNIDLTEKELEEIYKSPVVCKMYP